MIDILVDVLVGFCIGFAATCVIIAVKCAYERMK